MCKRVFYHILFFTLMAMNSFPPLHAQGLSLYVSKNGNDGWSGRLPEANLSRTDGPFATIERARREIRDQEEPLQNGVTVYIRGGNYTRTRKFELTAADSGKANSPIVWRNYPEEQVYFKGGIEINNWQAITDSAVLARIDGAYQQHILQADLTALGLTEFPEIGINGPQMELLFRDTSMTLSRFPNENWTKIDAVPSDSVIRYSADISDRLKRWTHADEIWLHGYFYWDWSGAFQAVDSIDTEMRYIYLKPPLHHYGFRAGQRYFFLNILEELDRPGEWFLDRKTGIIYFWPPETIDEGDVYFSMLDSIMVFLNETAHITIQGINFHGSYESAVKIQSGSDNKIAACTFRNIIKDAVVINGGERNGITGCDLYDLGAGGIILTGGDRLTLEGGDNYADNNHIHHYARIQKTYHPAVALRGVGQIVTHNYIHHAPHQAISWSGNEHLIEFNEIHDVAMETGDVGAMYSGRDWTWRGTVIRYNYLYDIQGPGHLGAMGVYLDDALSGTTIFGNIFHNIGIAVMIGGGRDNIVQNNIFVSNKVSVHVDDRGHGWAKDYIAQAGAWRMYEKLYAVNYNEPPYSEYYPELATILDGDPALPAGNKIIANVHYGGGWLDFDPDSWGGIVHFETNIVTFFNPGFINPADHNFQFKDDFYNNHPYFQYIPMDSIGLYLSEYRQVITDVKKPFGEHNLPLDFEMINYPNPFNASTNIFYELASPLHVKLSVYDVLGREVTTLVDKKQNAGNHKIAWTAHHVASGVFFIKIQAGSMTQSRKVLLLK